MGNLIDELEREKAHADHMSAMAGFWMQKAQDAQRTLAIIVKAAGGKVVVSYSDAVDARNLDLIRAYHAEDMTTHFITRQATSPLTLPPPAC